MSRENCFFRVLVLDSTIAFHHLDFSETMDVHQVRSVGNCHPDILAMVCGGFPFAFLGSTDALSFLK